MKNPQCYLQVRFRDHVQEHYETASYDAARRSAQLRKAGFRVISSALGPQVTNVGVVRMTMLTAYGDLDNLPIVNVERL